MSNEVRDLIDSRIKASVQMFLDMAHEAEGRRLAIDSVLSAIRAFRLGVMAVLITEQPVIEDAIAEIEAMGEVRQ